MKPVTFAIYKASRLAGFRTCTDIKDGPWEKIWEKVRMKLWSSSVGRVRRALVGS